MTVHALSREQRTAIAGHVEAAIAEIRRAMDVEPTAGPALVAGFATLSALAHYREVVDAMPIIEGKQAP